MQYDIIISVWEGGRGEGGRGEVGSGDNLNFFGILKTILSTQPCELSEGCRFHFGFSVSPLLGPFLSYISVFVFLFSLNETKYIKANHYICL